MRKLPADMCSRVDQIILSLADDPRPRGCLKLRGCDTLWRIRVGEWRITYSVEDEHKVVMIVEVAPQGSAYRITDKVRETEVRYDTPDVVSVGSG